MVNKLLDAAWELHSFFTKNGYKYAIIGGFALQYWGESRFTQDIDITVLSSPENEEYLVNLLSKSFTSRVSNPLKFALKNRIVLLKTKNEIPADVALGILGYEEGVIKRSVSIKLKAGKKINICSAEDLIIHKAVASRPRDIQDIEGIIFRQGKKLNVRVIRKWLKEFSELLPEVDVQGNFEKPWERLKEIR